MNPNESISDMYSRFQDVVHSLISLRKFFSEEDQVRKILNLLTPKWDQKTLAIEDANDISTMKIEELIGNLMSFEVQMLGRRESKASEKKSIAFNAIINGSDTNSDNYEEIALMTRNFRKFLKYRKMNNYRRNEYKNSGNSNDTQSNIRCFNCDEPGHLKRDCPHPYKQKVSPNNEMSKKRKRAYAATLDDLDSSSSDEDQETKNSNFFLRQFMNPIILEVRI